MKHGRRHNKLKEQAYVARKKAKGYRQPYDPMPVDEPTGLYEAADAPGLDLASALGRKSKHALKRAGVNPDARDDT